MKIGIIGYGKQSKKIIEKIKKIKEIRKIVVFKKSNFKEKISKLYYMNSYNNDYNFGKSKEAEALPIIKKYFNDDTIYQTVERFNPYDYIGKDAVYDIKSRTNTYNKYPTTIIKCYHLDKKPEDKDLIFLFYFTDGLYYIKYDRELFKTFDISELVRCKRAGITDYKEYHILVPINKLIKIT